MISSSTISNNRSSGPRAGWLRWITTGLHETKRILPRVPIKLLYSFEKRITNDVCFYCLVSFFTILFILTLLSLSLYLSAAVILIPFLYFPLVLPLCFSTILFILRFVRLFLYVYECGERRGWHTRRRKIRSKRVTIPELMGFQLFIFHNQFFYIYFHFFFSFI